MDKLKIPDAIQLKFWTDQPVIATILQLVLLTALTLAVIFCLATFGEFTHEYNKDRGQDEKVCFLFYEKSGNDIFCQFVTISHIAVALSLVTMFILLAFMRVHNPFDKAISIVSAINSIQMLLLSFITSIVLSVGFAETSELTSAIALLVGLEPPYNSIISTYGTVQSSTVLSWMETTFLGVVCVVSFLYLGLGAYRRSGNTSQFDLLNCLSQ